MNPEIVAYAAGMVDGDGTIQIMRRKRNGDGRVPFEIRRSF